MWLWHVNIREEWVILISYCFISLQRAVFKLDNSNYKMMCIICLIYCISSQAFSLIRGVEWLYIKWVLPTPPRNNSKKVSFYFCMIVCRIREPCQRSRGWHRLRRSHSSGSLGNLQADVQCWKAHSLWKGLAFGYFGHFISVLGHFFHTLAILFHTLAVYLRLAILLLIWPFF